MDINHPRVYDLLHPSPVSLKKITAASIALDLCREEINKYRRINALNRLHFHKISLDSLVPIIPSTLLQLIKKCKNEVESSIEHFVQYHYKYVFKVHHKDMNEVLRDFDDFVVDYDGSINYSKTAKRVLLCDRFSKVEKFVIACQYNFAEDVVKLWPSVSTIINIDDFEDSTHFKYSPLRYWILRLKSKRNYFGITDRVSGEQLLKEAECVPFHNITSTMEHFWEKIDSNARVRVAVEHFDKFLNEYEFCRYILPKLNEQELDVFMYARGEDLIPDLLKYEFWMDLVFPVWKLVKNEITEPEFIAIVRKIIDKQTNHSSAFDPSDCGEKIWEDASVHMKQLAIRNILSSGSSIFVRRDYHSCRQTGFLLKILSDMTIEERRSFWYKNWPHLISGTRKKDLQNLMKLLCIGNRNKVKHFKRNKLSRYKVIGPCCLKFLKDANYQELTTFLNFCCPRKETRKRIKSRLLHNDFKLSFGVLQKARLLDNFIKSTFVDEEEITAFKYNLTLKLAENDDLYTIALLGKYDQLKELVDTLVISEGVAVDLKERHFPHLIRYRFAKSTPHLHHFHGEELSNFLRWCFGDDEKVEQFKQSLPIDEIVRGVANEVLSENGLFKGQRRRRNYDLDAFMEWYFTNPESLVEFKTGFADLFEQIGQN